MSLKRCEWCGRIFDPCEDGGFINSSRDREFFQGARYCGQKCVLEAEAAADAEQARKEKKRLDEEDAKFREALAYMKENLVFLKGEEIDSSLKGKTVLGNNGKCILDGWGLWGKYDYTIRGDKVTFNISPVNTKFEEPGATGLLKICLEFINDNKVYTAATLYYNSVSEISVDSVETEKKYILPKNTTTSYKAPPEINNDTWSRFALYELTGSKNWILRDKHDFLSINEQKEKEREKIREQKAEAAKRKAEKEARKREEEKQAAYSKSRTYSFLMLGSACLWYAFLYLDEYAVRLLPKGYIFLAAFTAFSTYCFYKSSRGDNPFFVDKMVIPDTISDSVLCAIEGILPLLIIPFIIGGEYSYVIKIGIISAITFFILKILIKARSKAVLHFIRTACAVAFLLPSIMLASFHIKYINEQKEASSEEAITAQTEGLPSESGEGMENLELEVSDN